MVVVGNAPFIALHLLYMFPEARDVLVGYERKFKTAEVFLPLIDPRLNTKTVLGSNPGPEQIAALHPDVVITKATVVGPLDNVLSALGIPLVHLGIESPLQFLEDVRLVGTLLGNRSRAETIIGFYTNRLDLIRSGLQGLPPGQWPTVLLMEYSRRGGNIAVRVPGESRIQTTQTKTAGGRPVWTKTLEIQDGWQVINFEQIARWNPDHARCQMTTAHHF
jgi:iron complex transport system substrate-binding protein